MKVIDKTLLDNLTQQALNNPRLRMNHNFHESLDDSINRMLNAIEPESYIPPHRHINPDKEEIFIVLRGKILFFIFNDDGSVKSASIISPESDIYGMEIEAGIWHSLIVLEPGTVVYEIKRGPYIPLSPDNIAAWAPKPEDKESVKIYLSKLQKEFYK